MEYHCKRNYDMEKCIKWVVNYYPHYKIDRDIKNGSFLENNVKWGCMHLLG